MVGSFVSFLRSFTLYGLKLFDMMEEFADYYVTKCSPILP